MKRSFLLRLHANRFLLTAVCLVGLLSSAMAQNPVSRPPAPGGAARTKVIFDCDLGDDIDDAYALALLCASPELEVLGITTCYGRTDDRARLACQLLYDWGLDSIPVAVGRDTRTQDVEGQKGRANWYADQFFYAKGFTHKRPIGQSAADFISQQLKKYPGQVTIISVGPVQNMADVIKQDPAAWRLVKRVVAMFGSFYIGYNGSPSPDIEWNVLVDPAAAQTFVASGVPITYAGLDVTTFVKADANFRQQLLARQSPVTNALCGLHSLWGYDRDPTLYDAVAVGMVLWPDLFKTRSTQLVVDDKGYTQLAAAQPTTAEVAVFIDTPKFLERLMKVYKQQNLRR